MVEKEYESFCLHFESFIENGTPVKELECELMRYIQIFRKDIALKTDTELADAVLREQVLYTKFFKWLSKKESVYQEQWYHFGIFYPKKKQYAYDAVTRLKAYTDLHLCYLTLLFGHK